MRKQFSKYRPYKKPIFYCDEDFPQPSLQKAVLLTLDDDYLDNRKFKLSKTFGVVVIQAGRFPTWDRVNQVIEQLMPFLKSLDGQSLKSVKIHASLEGYAKWILKNNRIEKGEFNWKKFNASRRYA